MKFFSFSDAEIVSAVKKIQRTNAGISDKLASCLTEYWNYRLVEIIICFGAKKSDLKLEISNLVRGIFRIANDVHKDQLNGLQKPYHAIWNAFAETAIAMESITGEEKYTYSTSQKELLHFMAQTVEKKWTEAELFTAVRQKDPTIKRRLLFRRRWLEPLQNNYILMCKNLGDGRQEISLSPRYLSLMENMENNT